MEIQSREQKSSRENEMRDREIEKIEKRKEQVKIH